MDTAERDQIRLILEHEADEALRSSGKRQKALHAEHSAKGLLRSGATVKRAVSIVEDEAGAFVQRAIDKVAPVAQDIDAFTLITARLASNFRSWEREVADAVKLATASGKDRTESVKRAADGLFADVKERIGRELEIHRFSFTKPSRGDLAAKGIRTEAPAATKVQAAEKRNPGGKPLAPHWDEMWAAVAVKLWTGDLKPKSQADVKAAMFDWFNKAEIDVGDTALTQRARQLWQAMQDAES
ncbi:MAG: hypothetical protein H6915_01235 [Novosphingobium sp.]|nr:hypothetical protein [Novosphingobium sp.]MCP5388369.1 hypothetical protein [Novosphingobium sp.]